MKLLKTLALTVTALAGFSSLALAEDAPRTKDGFTLLPPEQQIYKTYLGAAPATLDPSYYVYSDDFYVARDLFETLVRQLPDGKTAPAAAESWSISDDGLVYTFKLNPKATWSDGKPVKAADFVYSWRRLTDAKTAAPYGSYLSQLNVVNADEIFKGKLPADQLGVKALDDLTFQVTLSQPTPWFLDATMLQILAPLRQDVIEQYGSDWVKPEHFVTNGPYKLSEYSARSHIKSDLRKDYYDASNIVIQQVFTDITESTDPNRNYFAYLTGQILTTGIPQQFRKKVRETRPEEVFNIASKDAFFVRINNEHFPDVEVRKALTYFWDSKFILEKVFPAGIDTGLLVPNNVTDGELVQEPEWHKLNMEERAKQGREILAAKGYSKDKPLKLKFLTVGKPTTVSIAFVERFNKHAQGIAKVEFDIVGDSKGYLQKIDLGNYDLSTGGWTVDFNHIANALAIFVCGDPNNKQKYCNPEFDKQLALAAKTLEPQARKQAYAKAVATLQGDFPAIPFYQTESIQLKSPRLQGLAIGNDFRYARDLYLTTLKAKPE